MERSPLARWREARKTSDDRRHEDVAREELRGRLLTAAEEEAAAIVEDTRQQILLAVRRARRDLLRVQTQLQLYNLENPEPRPDGPDPLVVRHTTTLRQIAREAATELDLLSTVRPAVTMNDVTVTDVTVEGVAVNGAAAPGVSASDVTVNDVSVRDVTEGPPAEPELAPVAWPPSPNVSKPQLVIAAIVALVVFTGLAGLTYSAATLESAMPPAPPVPIVAQSPAPDRPAPEAETVTPALSAAVQDSAAAPGSSSNRATPDEQPRMPEPLRVTQPPTSPAASVAPAVQRANEVATADRPATAAASSSAATDDPQAAIFAKHVQWLDAYGRNDRQAMAGVTTAGFSLRDERAPRSANADAAGSTPAQVTDVHIDIAGPGAVLTARLHNSVGGVASESLLSEVWVRGEQQQWALMGVRITPVERLPQPGTR